MLASKELQRRRQCHSQSLTITAKKLADFLQSVEADELLMTQRLRDQEAQARRKASVPVAATRPYSVDSGGEAAEGNNVADFESGDSDEIYGEF